MKVNKNSAYAISPSSPEPRLWGYILGLRVIMKDQDRMLKSMIHNIERLERKLKNGSHVPSKYKTGRQLSVSKNDELSKLREAVVILDDDAEPELGDILQSTQGVMEGVSCGYLFAKYWQPKESMGLDNPFLPGLWTITPRFGDGSSVGKHWANPKEWQKIVQRDNKPVIYKSALKTTSGVI